MRADCSRLRAPHRAGQGPDPVTFVTAVRDDRTTRHAVRGRPLALTAIHRRERRLPCLPPKWEMSGATNYRSHQPGAGVDRVAGSGDAARAQDFGVPGGVVRTL